MNNIVKMEFGSKVYGTDLPSSDTDYKAIYIPSARDIAFQTVKKSIIQNTKKNTGLKNTQNDIDFESLALHHYLNLVSINETQALDMLFVPKKHWIQSSDTWERLVSYKNYLISRKVSPFIGYVKKQADKYGIRGSKIQGVKKVLDLITPEYQKNPQAKLIEFKSDIIQLSQEEKSIKIRVDVNHEDGHTQEFLEVYNKYIPFHADVKHAYKLCTRLVSEFGKRAEDASNNKGIDFKSLYHAVRILNQAKELLTTGNIIFPRPDRELLLKIRNQEIHYRIIQDMIETGIVEVEELSQKSGLPDSPDLKFIETLVKAAYGVYERAYTSNFDNIKGI